MKLIDADAFLWKLEDYAITDADREFCRKVKFALDKEQPVNVIPIEFLNVLAKARPGMISATISLIKDKWGEEREKDGQVKSEHSGSSQGAENVAADRPPFDGIGPAPDRGLRTAEGLQPDGVFCIQKNAGRRKDTARDRIVEAVRKIDELIETTEPIEEIDDICRKTANITECANMISENLAAKKLSEDHYISRKLRPIRGPCERFRGECGHDDAQDHEIGRRDTRSAGNASRKRGISMTAAKKTALLITAVFMAAYMALFFQIMAEGSTTGMYSRTAEGNVYISETGWLRIGNDTYYIHETFVWWMCDWQE